MSSPFRRLQVLQNKISSTLKTGLGYETPTQILMKQSSDLTVQQLTAYHTLMTVFKAVQLGKPVYLANKFQLRKSNGDDVFPLRQTDRQTQYL